MQRPPGHKVQAWRITKGQPHYHPSIELQPVAASLLKPYQKRKRKAYLFNALLPQVKHAWFDSTESGLADRRPFPTGVALPDQEELWLQTRTRTTRKQRILSPFLQVEKLSRNANQEPFWSPNLISIIHLPFQPDSLNLPSMTSCHIFLRSFMTVLVGCSCSTIIIMIQVPYFLIIVQSPEERFPGLSEQEMKLYRQYDPIHIKAQVKWVTKSHRREIYPSLKEQLSLSSGNFSWDVSIIPVCSQWTELKES